jgi:hypothetical protein
MITNSEIEISNAGHTQFAITSQTVDKVQDSGRSGTENRLVYTQASFPTILSSARNSWAPDVCGPSIPRDLTRQS